MKTLVLSLLALTALFTNAPAFAIDQVILNNGQTVEGTVLNDIPNRYVDIRLVNGDTKRFEKTQVSSVERDVPSRKDRQAYGYTSLGFFAVNLGGAYNMSGSNNNVAFDYGVKIGGIANQDGDTKLGFSLSYDRNSNTSNGFSYAYNDINAQMQWMRIGGSGFYFGPNVGLEILTRGDGSIGTTFIPGNTSNYFEAGAQLGYEAFVTDTFAVGPDVRYDYLFSPKMSLIRFTLQGTFHF